MRGVERFPDRPARTHAAEPGRGDATRAAAHQPGARDLPSCPAECAWPRLRDLDQQLHRADVEIGLAELALEVLGSSSTLMSGDEASHDGGHDRAVIVSERFAGLNRLRAQQVVYSVVDDWMGGEIHPLGMKTFTPEGWKAEG